MEQALQVVGVVFGLAGAYFNVKKKYVCWWLWMISNIAWFNWALLFQNNWQQAILWAVYFAIAMKGAVEWRS